MKCELFDLISNRKKFLEQKYDNVKLFKNNLRRLEKYHLTWNNFFLYSKLLQLDDDLDLIETLDDFFKNSRIKSAHNDFLMYKRNAIYKKVLIEWYNKFEKCYNLIPKTNHFQLYYIVYGRDNMNISFFVGLFNKLPNFNSLPYDNSFLIYIFRNYRLLFDQILKKNNITFKSNHNKSSFEWNQFKNIIFLDFRLGVDIFKLSNYLKSKQDFDFLSNFI